MHQYKNFNIRNVVNDSEWQALRKSFLNTWKHQPIKNVEILKNYLQHGSGTIKLRALRIYNYLTGTGFRLGIIKHIEIDRLREKVKRMLS